MKDQLAKLEEGLRSRALVNPASGANLVDLALAIARSCGSGPAAATEGARWVEELLDRPEHLVVFLVDGLGDAQLANLPEAAFLRRQRVGRLHSVFPSATAAALTSLATAEWPARHGAVGWWVYLPARGFSVVTLPFARRSDGEPLEKLGIAPEEVFLMPSYWEHLGHRPMAVLPEALVASLPSRHLRAGAPALAYESLQGAAEQVVQRVLKASHPTLTYVYFPALDTLEHELGPAHPDCIEALTLVDRVLEETATALRGRARLVVTGDHGQVSPEPKHRHIIQANDPLLQHLRCLPTGEPPVPIFHLRPEKEAAAAFTAAFLERFGESFALCSADELAALGLFGPSAPTPTVRERLGDFLAVPLLPAAFFSVQGSQEKTPVGVHGGLTPAEVEVPLIVA